MARPCAWRAKKIDASSCGIVGRVVRDVRRAVEALVAPGACDPLDLVGPLRRREPIEIDRGASGAVRCEREPSDRRVFDLCGEQRLVDLDQNALQVHARDHPTTGGTGYARS
jgi:hypothetical protein